MEHNYPTLLKTVFRLRGLPRSVKSPDDVANLVSKSLGDILAHDVRVFSLATNLGFGNNSPSKVATLMFSTIPSIIRDKNSKNEWETIIPGPETGHILVLDTHFEGMTTINDVDYLSHRFDCIAISGLASHPFGSWQPKNSDKTFMWIRDVLPKHVYGIRAVVYGYETRLAESRSFERIKDLASRLIALLTTYGWGSRSSKPIIFLAHSLGGLVLRDALRQLSDSSTAEYKTLSRLFRGALFFGVPNLGIEQDSFQTIVQGNPNDTLIDDIRHGSNYLRRLNDYFSRNPIEAHFKQFWAYETLESPTVVVCDDSESRCMLSTNKSQRTSRGEINQNGPRAILVSRESATLRSIESNSSVTFPIKATHSDMVKFTRESPDYHIVVSKISSIVNDNPSNDSQRYNHQNYASHQAAETRTDQTRSCDVEENMTAELQVFRRVSGLTAAEETKFQNLTFDTIQTIIRDIQLAQEERQSLMYMQRLEPVLISMKQFSDVTEAIGVTFGLCNPMVYVWVRLKQNLVTSLHPDIFNCLLDAYQEIGEQIPNLQIYQERIASNRDLRHILVFIYSDIMWFHREILRQVKQRGEYDKFGSYTAKTDIVLGWKTLFISTWGDFATCLDQIKANISRSHRLISGDVSFKEIEEIRNLRASSLHTFKMNKTAEDISHRATIRQWLSSYNCEAEQARHRKTRSICQSPGSWLLKDSRFLNWSTPEFCSYPFIWLNGIPGAGKTILASIIVDHLQHIPGATVAYFYFLSSCEKTYIIIDGVDECGHNDRDEIAEVFRTTIEDLPAEAAGSVRCAFISQDDNNARRNFRDLPAIKIVDENQDDLKDFAKQRHKAIEDKFGPLKSNDCYISAILVARSRGMFIFADLFAKYLEAQLSRAALLEELDPSKLPVSLDHVYTRILERVFETRNGTSVAAIRQVLGWITCARRPLKWAEVQGAVCVDFDNQVVDHERMLSDSPKDLFASLIEIKEDDTVELVHETARVYLCKHLIDFREVNYSLAMVSIGYLTLPQLDMDQQEGDESYSNLVNGTYSFYDYASACWAMHLQEGISELKPSAELTQLLESLETFIEIHWSRTHKPLQDLKRVRSSMESVKTSECFDKIVYAVGWAKRQSSKYGQGPSPDEALDLWQVTKKVRSVLEDARPSDDEEQKLRRFYGLHWFKCPRVNCLRYYQGFSTLEERQHHLNKHERPFLCYITGCHMEVFGYATSNELKQHLLKYHGIGSYDDTSDTEFPDPPKRKAVTTVISESKYECTECDKKFTRNHNLRNHLRTHQGLRPHLRDHFLGKGKSCIKPYLEEKMQDSSEGSKSDAKLFDDQFGETADTLRTVGNSLPPFQEFLRLCGLVPPVTKP
ncbi:hypothetical protein FHL15_008808 [Xylaria flabelliformis]|uniref:C2H2-type domain-containing protein n=1 Tax=Xylaria flabelliformis TaxID=2512241 RepID=A0A553HQN3_9PEZI|nr:hypothetical protein FHL15_008808 [Xylaria flabelliformis]